MIKKLISMIFIVFCLITACALDTDSDKNEQAAKTDTTGAKTMKITITANGKTLTASLYDNSSSRALVELLQKGAITIEMHDYGSFEKVGDLPISLPRNDKQTNTDAGDLILYQGKSFVIYYDKNSWDFTLLGKLEGITKAELKKLLGTGNVTVILENAE